MKILFFRYGSIVERGIIASFREIGAEVNEIGQNIKDKSMFSKEIIEEVSRELISNPVDLVFSVNFFPNVSDVCNAFHIRYFSWTVDSPVMELFTKQISNEWNRTFIFDKAQYEDIIKYNPDRIFHLPLAVNIKDTSQVIGNSTDNIRAKYSHNVSFVGSLYSEKNPYDDVKGLDDYTRGVLDGIISAQEKVYGYYFVDEVLEQDIIDRYKVAHPSFYSLNVVDSYLNDKITMSQLYIGNKITERERYHTFKYLSENIDVDIYTLSNTDDLKKICNHGGCNSVTEMPLVFNGSKININTTSKAIRTGIPQRVFDIVSCGGFVLSNYQSEIVDCLEPGKDIAVYSSIEECLDLCKYYLEHESERKEIAVSGFETAKEKHTYEIRLVQMLKLGLSV